jgi:hypothetical protein
LPTLFFVSVAPGWYDDGVTPAIERWYDGAAWTEHTRAVPPISGSAPSGWTTTGATAGATTFGATTFGATTARATSRAAPGATTVRAAHGVTTAGSATPTPIEGSARVSGSPAWPVTTAWPVTPQTRGSAQSGSVSVPGEFVSVPGAFVSEAAIEAARSAEWGAPSEVRPAAQSGDDTPFGKPAGSEKYPEGWGPSGYEIGPERSRAHARTKAEPEPETDWCVLPTGTPSSGAATPGATLSSGRSPAPWPLPGQALAPMRRPGATPSDPVHWLIPVGRSWQSIVGGYLGLVGLLIWPLAPFAVWLGFWGRGLSRAGGNGGGRAVFAIVSGLVGTFVGVFVLMAVLRG